MQWNGDLIWDVRLWLSWMLGVMTKLLRLRLLNAPRGYAPALVQDCCPESNHVHMSCMHCGPHPMWRSGCR